MAQLKVLVVDDEPSIRLTMTEFLRRAGYEALAAADCEQAEAVMRAAEVDIAVLDINLPRRSGIELLQELSRREPHVPVIMITGEPNLAQLPEIVRAGAYDFIAKPVVKEAIIAAVARAAEKKRLSDEKRRLESELVQNARELERSVEERVAALGRAAAQVAHEVKNPLTGLRLYSMHLRRRLAEGECGAGELELADSIVDTINHLMGTVEQLMSYARPLKLAPTEADLNAVVVAVLQLLGPQMEANGVELDARLDETAPRARLDESSIRSAIINLVLNAIQAMPEGGRLEVYTERGEGAVTVEIADTGAGMTEEQAARIFEPFYTTRSQGLGLGLPYAKRVVEQHGGEIVVESRPGAGTRLRVVLPAEPGG